METYENTRDALRRGQAAANKKNDIVTVLKLFAARHYLIMNEFAVNGENDIDIDDELTKLGERIIAWFELEFTSEDTVDGFAPEAKNVNLPFSITSFLVSSNPEMMNVPIEGIKKEVLSSDEIKELLSEDDIDLIADMGEYSTSKEAIIAERFLEELSGYVLLDSERPSTRTMSSMFKRSVGLSENEKQIILGYLTTYIQFQYTKTIKKAAMNEAYLELHKKSVEEELFIGDDAIEEAATALQEGLESENAAAAIMKGRKQFDKDEFDKIVADKTFVLTNIAAEKARNLARQLLKEAMDEGGDSAKILAEYRENQRDGFGSMVTVKKHFINIGMGGLALFAGIYERSVKEYFSKSKTIWVNSDGVEVPPPAITEQGPAPVEDSYTDQFWELLGYEKEALEPALPGVPTQRIIYDLVDGDKQAALGAVWNLCKLCYAMVVPVSLIITVVFGGSPPVGIIANVIGVIRLIQFVMGTIAVYDALPATDSGPQPIVEGDSPENEWGWLGVLIRLISWMFTQILSNLRHLIVQITFIVIHSNASNYFLACVGLIQLLTALYMLLGVDRIKYNAVREGADIKLLSDLGEKTFKFQEIIDRADKSLDEKGRFRDISTRINAEQDTIKTATEIVKELKESTTVSARLAELNISQQTLRLRQEAAQAQAQPERQRVEPVAMMEEEVDLTFDE